MRVIEVYDNGQTVNVEGIGHHRINGVPLGSAGGVVDTHFNTTQYVRMPVGREILKKRYESPHPALNVFRRAEPVAMDTVYSGVPAIDDGSKHAQVYVGTASTVTDVYGMKSEKELVNTLEDNIRERGAMKLLISDNAQSEISKRIQDILRTLCIPSWQSEPYQQNQNPCEHRIQDIKRMTNTLLDRTGCLPGTWLLRDGVCVFYSQSHLQRNHQGSPT